MTHQEIEQQEIIERYVRHKLTPDERRAFQEHYFSCESCFAETQTAARFVAGVRNAARAGAFDAATAGNEGAAAWWMGWLNPAFACAAAACLVLTVALGWVVFKQLPALREEAARERQAREQAARDKEAGLAQAQAELERERRLSAEERAAREELQTRLDELAQNSPSRRPDAVGEAQANVPLVLLEAQRDAQAGSNQLVLPAGAKSATLWVELAPETRYESFQLEVLSADKRLLTTIAGARANSYGALAVTVPARMLQRGKYLVRAYGVKGGQHTLVGEYDLLVRRQ